MHSIVITGVAGLLGSRLADWFIQNKPEYKIIGIDNLMGGYESNIHPKVDFHKIDLATGDLSHIFDDKVDYVYHFAAYAAEGLSPFIRKFNYTNNLIATANIINNCIKYNVKRLVFTSSMATYGVGNPPFDEKDRPIISLGMKGLIYAELIAKGPVRDAHSSLAVLIENPAWRLVCALNTIRDQNGKILIKDWYKEVRPFTEQELSVIASEPFDVEEFKKEYGVSKFVADTKGTDIKKALVGMPTCNIAGFNSGYLGEGAKTVLPSQAVVKIDFRLVPGMVPEKQLERLNNHLREHGFSDIEVKLIHGEAAARTPISDPFVRQVEQAAKETFGSAIISVSSAGTGPMYSFAKMLKAPCISIGSTYMFARIHSPNEFARIDLLNKMTKCIGRVMERFAS
jgi:hypothetical protein